MAKLRHCLEDIVVSRSMSQENLVRNVFIKSLMKIAYEVTAIYSLKLNEKEIKKIAIDPRFQEAVRQFMSEEYYDKT